jgi:hypothetical protein
MEIEFEDRNDVAHRLILLRFLSNVLSAKTPYLGTLILPLPSISALYNSPTLKESDVVKYRKRSFELFTFGLSLSKLLTIYDQESFSKALFLLVGEFGIAIC